MTIAPIRHTITVKADPERAFLLFASSMGHWWPVGRTVGAAPHVDIIVEPKAGGRWFERDAEGAETQWGCVLAWEPPTRLLLGWQLNSAFAFDAALLTEVELTFVAAPGGGTLVTLEHRNLERFGADAERVTGLLNSGWPTLLNHYGHWSETT